MYLVYFISVLTAIYKRYADARTRTWVGAKPTGPKPVPFDHSGTSAAVRGIVTRQLFIKAFEVTKKTLLQVSEFLTNQIFHPNHGLFR